MFFSLDICEKINWKHLNFFGACVLNIQRPCNFPTQQDSLCSLRYTGCSIEVRSFPRGTHSYNSIEGCTTSRRGGRSITSFTGGCDVDGGALLELDIPGVPYIVRATHDPIKFEIKNNACSAHVEILS